MSSSSSQTVSSSLQRSNELADVTSNKNPPSFAPLHRTAELENLHDHSLDDEKQTPKSTPTKKILTKCMTVIGDGSDKQI
jgi:hypothetical protein